MGTLLFPLSARFIVYTFVLVITAILLFESLFWWSSVYVAIPLALFAAPSVVGTVDLLQTKHAVLRNHPLALIVTDKSERVFNFHRATMESLAELVAATGLDHPTEFRPVHFSRRVSPHEVMTFAELYPSLKSGELLAGAADKRFCTAWAMAHAAEFRAVV